MHRQTWQHGPIIAIIVWIIFSTVTSETWAKDRNDPLADDGALTVASIGALAASIPPRGDYLPDVATTLIHQNHMRRGRDTEGNVRYEATVPIRRDIVWPDGVELTAHHVAAAYEKAINAAREFDLSQGAPSRLGLDPWHRYILNSGILEKVEATDDDTVTFTLRWMPGIGEWQYGLMTVPILRSFRAWHDGDEKNDRRRLENIVLFQNGSAAISNPLTGYTYLPAGIGGEVALSLTRPESLAYDYTPERYFLGLNLHLSPIDDEAWRRAIAAAMKGDRDAHQLPAPTLTLTLSGPLREKDEIGAQVIQSVAETLSAFGFRIRILPRQPADEITEEGRNPHLFVFSIPGPDEIISSEGPASLGVAQLFLKAKGLFEGAWATGLPTQTYRQSFTRLISSRDPKRLDAFVSSLEQELTAAGVMIPLPTPDAD